MKEQKQNTKRRDFLKECSLASIPFLIPTVGSDTKFPLKNKNLENRPWMMTSVFFFWKIDRKKFYSEHVLLNNFRKREKSRRKCEIPGVWRIGERNIGEIVDRLCNNAFYTKTKFKIIYIFRLL